MSEFDQRLQAVLAEVIPGFERLVSARRLSGGASQETYRIEFEARGESLTLAMRRAAGGVPPRSDAGGPGLEAEALLMRVARDAGVPEPEVYHVLREGDGLGPGFVMAWLEGEALGSKILRAPELDGVRPRLAKECGQILARIHGIDPTLTGLAEHLNVVSTEDFVRRLWDEYRHYDTPQPMIDYTARWLLDHLPQDTPYSGPRLVHNDFRNGNLMVTPEGVTAVLDWELAHLGDPIRDLGWICTNSWRFGVREMPVGGFGTLDELLEGYEEISGIRVSKEHVHFWEVFGSFWWAVGCLRMADAYRNGPDKTVERPGIARRSSECQVDCANLIIPGPVELVVASAAASSIEMPRTDELITSVRDFLRGDARKALEGRSSFMALVASNSLDIVLRELSLGPAHLAAEHARLRGLFDSEEALEVMRRRLAHGLQDGSIALDREGLADHLRLTVVNQLAIDQPRYSGLSAALAVS